MSLLHAAQLAQHGRPVLNATYTKPKQVTKPMAWYKAALKAFPDNCPALDYQNMDSPQIGQLTRCGRSLTNMYLSPSFVSFTFDHRDKSKITVTLAR